MPAAKMTIARAKLLLRAIEAPVVVATSRDLRPDDNGKVLDVTAAVTLTARQDTLPAGFCCKIIAPSGVNVSIARTGTLTLNGAGTTLTRARAANAVPFEFIVRAANTALVGGA